MEEKKKQSVLRYVGVMFAVAFVLVVVSLISTNKNMSDVSEGAMENMEKLQEDNRYWQDQVVELTAQVAELTAQLEDATSSPRPEHVQKAYEMLLTENLEELEEYKGYLGTKGLELYENLMKEGNEQ